MEQEIELQKEEMLYNVLSIGEVTKGEEASATITGKEPNQVLNLVLPKGDKGDQGEVGPTGPQGPKGDPGSVENFDFEDLSNIPKINNVELKGNKSLSDLGIQPSGNYANSGDIPTKLSDLTNDANYVNETQLNAIKLNSFTTTLTLANWTLNSTTSKYEYNVTNANITANHYVEVIFDIENQEKFSDKIGIDSYNGGFKITSNSLPESNVAMTVIYQLTSGEVQNAG